MKVWGLPITEFPWVFYSMTYPHRASNNLFYSSDFSTLALVPMDVSTCVGFCSSRLWFSVFACLSTFGGGGLPCDLTSLTELRRIIDCFQFAQLFICWNSKLLTC